MKFANKIFLATTTVLTIIFMIFGMWMLSAYFNKSLEREMEQADTESRMYQYLFEMAYEALAEYGESYAMKSAIDSAAANVEKSGSYCFAWSTEEVYYGDMGNRGSQLEGVRLLAEELENANTCAYGVRQMEDGYYMLSVCKTQVDDKTVYLGISKDVTTMYRDRQELMNQYRIALFALVLAGGLCIYILSQYITKPIRKLDIVVGRIANGNYEQRSDYISGDEIGTLAGNFNHMADRLMEQMHEKEKEAKQKEDFTAAFAHELKTPLTSIIGYADMLNTIPMSEEEQREAYYYIYHQGKRLERLSHKLLELVSVEQAPLQIRPVNTKELEEFLRTTMRPVFERKKVKGKILLEKGIIYGDRDLLLSVFYNLLDNAIKATAEDGFVLLKGAYGECGYEVKVVDNGRGISESDVERITEAFYMVDKSRSRKEGGAGIGMALCQKIIALHKGEMQIKSKLGEGTVIRILFQEGIEQK